MTAPSPLDHAFQRLGELGLLPRAVAPPQGLEQQLVRAILDLAPAFAQTGNPDALPQMQQHVRDHIAHVSAILSGTTPDFAFVADHARWQAAARFPLEVSIRAYHAGDQVIGGWVATQLPADEAARFSRAYANHATEVLTRAYVGEMRRLTEVETTGRAEIFSLLLNGYDESDPSITGPLRRLGWLDQRQAYVVAVIQPAQTEEMENPARVQRLTEALGDAMGRTRIRHLSGQRGNQLVGIFADRRRQSGWTAPESDLSVRLAAELDLLAPLVRVGLSLDHPATAFLPQALAEARIALGFAGPVNRAVRFADLPVRALLLHFGAARIRANPPPWLAPLAAEPELCATLAALAAESLNLAATARRLGRHINTVYQRIERLRGLTGKEPLRLADLEDMRLALDAWAG